jgi:tRNA modification GTPase
MSEQNAPARKSACVTALTAPGRGAVAALAVWGPGALAAVDRFFRAADGRPLTERRVGRAVFGLWQSQAERPAEEVVLAIRDVRNVEVLCHGGEAAVRRIERTLIDGGCQRAGVAQWVHQRAAEPLAAEAWLGLSLAETSRAAAVLLDQYRGALASRLRQIGHWLESGHRAPAEEALAELRRHAVAGLHLLDPWRVVLAGKPNTGKSSLANALLGFQRSIVHAEAGTTRDVLAAATAIDGWPVELVDTAGHRSSAAGSVENEGIARAGQALRTADLVLLVTDLTTPWTAAEMALLQAVEPQQVVVVHNKCDLEPVPCAERPVGHRTSALTRHGLPALLETLVQRLVPDPPPRGAAVPFRARHVELLEAAHAAVRNNQTALASQKLEQLLNPG